MITEQLIRQNKARHQELLREAAQSRIVNDWNNTSAAGEALARTGDLLVAIGHGLQRRYRRVEEGVAEYASGRHMGRAL